MRQHEHRDETATDAELVRALRAGRQEAFEPLIDRYERRALSIAYRLLGNLHDALEVAQEAFARAYRRLDHLNDEGRFGPWLLRIVTNLALNRRRARRPHLSLDLIGTGDPQAPAGEARDPRQNGHGPSSDMLAEELAERIRTGLAQLPERQRAALVLYSLQQLPQREVATILGCSVEAVKWHVFQARQKLRRRLEE